MPETAVAPAPAAASSPAPAASPAPSAPASAPAPVSTPAAAPAAAQPTFGRNSGVTSHVDPTKFQGKGSFDKNAYTEAVLNEQLAGIAVEDAPAPVEEAAVVEEVTPVAEPTDVPEVPAPDAEVKPPEPVAEEEDFQLEPEPIVTPETLTQMVTDNPEFGKLLEADPKLKGQLYKTAREAAELKPYREIFPDLDSAKSAVAAATEYGGVKEIFMGSTTKEGTMATLGKIAELSYERDADGNVVEENGKPVIGQDFFSFVDNVVAIDLEHSGIRLPKQTPVEVESALAEVEGRLNANRYHLTAKTEAERDAAIARDQQVHDRFQRLKAAFDILSQEAEATADPEVAQLPESLRQKAADLDRREQALTQRQHGEKVEERTKFESGLQTEAQGRITADIGKIIASVEKQGGVISPYLKEILPKAIAAKVIAKIRANPALQDQMAQLQRLPINDASKKRRIEAIDRHVQQYLPDVAREEIRAAGVQVASASAAKLAKVNGQIDATKKTEVRGSSAPAGTTRTPMTAAKAYETAQAEWMQKNPGRRFDKSAEASILGRVVNLQLQ